MAGMGNFVPSSMDYSARVLDGVSTNTFRLLPNSSTTVAPSGQVSVAIPDGALVGMNTLRMYAKVTGIGAGTAPDVVHARLPQVTDMIQRVTVSCNGVQINGANGNYGDSMSMSKICKQDYSRSQSVDATLSNGNISSALQNQGGTFCWHDWENIFGQSSAPVLSTGMAGSIVLNIQFQDNSCLVPTGAAGVGGVLTAGELANAPNIRYTLEDIVFTIDCYSIAGGFYEALLQGRLEQEDIAINYLETYYFGTDNISGNSSNARFALATRCLDRVFAGSRKGDYADVGKIATVLQAGIGNAFRPNRTAWQCFDPAENATYQWQMNNSNSPAFRAPLVLHGANSTWSQTDEGFNNGMLGKGNSIYGLGDYKQGLGVVCQSYKMPTGLQNPMQVTCGLNTAGVNSSGLYSVAGQQGITSADQAAIAVVAHTQAQLICSLGRGVSASF